MEPEPKGRKRRVDDTELVPRAAHNPFYLRPDTNVVVVDTEMIARPEYQALLHALYEHYQRGSAIPLPFSIFPVQDLPEEQLLLNLANGDARTFINLLNSTTMMQARMKPLTARFVCQTWPDVALLLAMACDLQLIQQLERLNAAFPDAESGYLMGVGAPTYHQRSRVANVGLQTNCVDAVREQDLPRLNEWLRQIGGSQDRNYYLVLTGDKDYRLYRRLGAIFNLPFAGKCHFSDVAAMKLVAEVMERGHVLGLQWRYNESHRNLRRYYKDRTADFMNFGSLPEELSQWTYTPGEHWKNASPYKRVMLFTMELIDALVNDPAQAIAPTPTMFEFQGIELVPESEGFSVDAAHLRTMLMRHERDMEEIERRGLPVDPLYVDLLSVDVLSNQVCLMTGAADCAALWYDILRNIFKVMAEYDDETRRKGYMSAPYQCTECRETATCCDATFKLPFCAQKDCMRSTFAKLHQHGLWHGQ